MIGKSLESPPRFAWGTIVCLAIGVTMLLVAAWLHNRHLALAAVMPICMSLGFWLALPPRFRVTVTEAGLELGDSRGLVPYDEIEMLRFEGRGKAAPRSPLHVYHQRGVLVVPAALDSPREELHEFLLDQVAARRRPDTVPDLANYLDEQRAAFDADRVWSYRARRVIGPLRSSRAARWVLTALVVGSLLWVAAGMVLDESGWMTVGFVCATCFSMIFLATFATRPTNFRGIKNWRQAGLVISPLGIALSQGDIKGQLRWNEVRDVRLSGARSFQLSSEGTRPGVWLKVNGATVLIVNIYDAPPATIYEQIYCYWRQPG